MQTYLSALFLLLNYLVNPFWSCFISHCLVFHLLFCSIWHDRAHDKVNLTVIHQGPIRITEGLTQQRVSLFLPSLCASPQKEHQSTTAGITHTGKFPPTLFVHQKYHKKLEGWNTSSMKKGWEGWVSPAWRREGSGETTEQPSRMKRRPAKKIKATLRQDKGF